MRALVTLSVLVLAGCNGLGDASHLHQQLSELRQQVGASTKELAEVKDRLSNVLAKLEELELKAGNADLVESLDKIAYLTPGADGYTVIKSDLGHLTVSLADVRPYANGTKVALRFGNLTAATINGLKAKLDWGVVRDGIPQNESAKSREVKFIEPLRPGGWTRSEIVLEGIPSAELGFVRVSELSHTGIALAGRR
jgi:hypothetical protein